MRGTDPCRALMADLDRFMSGADDRRGIPIEVHGEQDQWIEAIRSMPSPPGYTPNPRGNGTKKRTQAWKKKRRQMAAASRKRNRK